jgi:hypothetical protein
MNYPVKHFHSGQRGAPALTAAAGTIIALLDAVFTTGFGVVTAQSVTVADGIATATLPLNQSFEDHAVVLVEGATPAALNGEARVLPGASSTQVQWQTAAADGSASGSITIKMSPATWWSKQYSGVNKAAYRSTDPLSHGHLLRIDDSSASSARLVGYESMADVDTGDGPFPSGDAGYIWKYTSSPGATAIPWRLFADSRAVLISVQSGYASSSTYTAGPLRGFGDPLELRPGGDVWSTFLSASGNSTSAVAPLEGCGASSSSGFTVSPRSWTGLGASVLVTPMPFSGSYTAVSGADTAAMGAFPSVIDGELKLCQMFLAESNAAPRAILPGVYRIAQSGAIPALLNGATVAASGALQGRRRVVIWTGSALGSSPSGAYVVDATGPWR